MKRRAVEMLVAAPTTLGAVGAEYQHGVTEFSAETGTVDDEGVVRDLHGASSGSIVARHPALARYARALIRVGGAQLRFVWIECDLHWHFVSMRVDGERGRGVTFETEAVAPPYGLTARELDILTLLAAGFSNEVIAARLDISQRTVTKHVENLFHKVEVRTRSAVAGIAVDRGLLRLPTPGGAQDYPLRTGAVEQVAARLDSAPGPSRKAAVRRPIIVGMPLCLEGRGAADARGMVDGARLAVAQINARGGVLGRDVELRTVNCDTSSAGSVRRALETLIADEVDAITAGYSCVEPEMQQLIAEFRGPYLHAATMESVVECVRDNPSKLGNIFQICASDVNYGLGLARFLRDLEQTRQWVPRNRRLAVVQPPWPGLDIGIGQVDQGAGRRGWTIDMLTDVPGAGRAWDAVVSALHRLDPSVVVVASYFVEDALAFQDAFSRAPLPALVYKLYSPSIPCYREILGDKAEGVVWATTNGLYNDQFGRRFVRDYRSRFGRDPGQSHAGISFDRINILAASWGRVGSPRAFGGILEDLRRTVHRGVNGSYFFGTDGQVGMAYPDDTRDPSISQAHLVFQVQRGAQVILSPEPYVDGRFVQPAWIRG